MRLCDLNLHYLIFILEPAEWLNLTKEVIFAIQVHNQHSETIYY